MEQDKNTKKGIFELLITPLKTIGDSGIEFTVWFLFTVLAGQLGIIFNIIYRSIFSSYSLEQAIYMDSINGSFYTYSIALLATSIGIIFVNFFENRVIQFKVVKIFTLMTVLFSWLFASIFYAYSQSKETPINFENISFQIDKAQSFFFLFSIFIAIYAFSVIKLELNAQKYSALETESYAKQDDEQVERLNSSAISANKDSKGNIL